MERRPVQFLYRDGDDFHFMDSDTYDQFVLSAAQLDDAARGVIRAAGFEQYFVHRTGHSIDRDLHGSGPHLDNYETHDDRALAAEVGFSVEPGVYLTGRFGVRSEIKPVLTASCPMYKCKNPPILPCW